MSNIIIESPTPHFSDKHVSITVKFDLYLKVNTSWQLCKSTAGAGMSRCMQMHVQVQVVIT